MLRVHFTADDLVSTTVAASVDPLWEMVFSRLRLSTRSGAVFEPWARRVRPRLGDHEVRAGLDVLAVLSPRGPYFPDFLTPAEGAIGLRPAIDAIRATPRTRLRRELQRLSLTSTLPPWAGLLAAGDADLLAELGKTLVDYHHRVLEPHSDLMQAAVDADRAHRRRALLTGGCEELLRTMRPLMRWRPPVLEVDYPSDRDLLLAGRGLRLVPSYLCQHTPVALADPDLAPTLVYPVNHEYVGRGAITVARPGWHDLSALLGTTRAQVLAEVGDGTTTGDLAQRLGVSPAAVSRHTTVLRRSGLITTTRQTLCVLHVLTPLGNALLARTP